MVVFAAQWYAYDASHGSVEPFAFYLGWSGYMWAVLTPAALWLGWKFPITSANWRREVPLHLAASFGLTAVQISLEAYFGWLRHRESLSASGAFRHYFKYLEQVSLLTYWLLVLGALFYRAREDAREGRLRTAELNAQLSEARLESLRRQLHPHFLFNTLQAAITLVHEDRDRAEDVLLRLSDLLRLSLQDSRAHEISLSRELEMLSLYTGIQTCRFGDRLSFDFVAEPEVLSCAVPPMILQPLVENAVRHGIGRHKESDTITFRAFRQGSSLHLEVCNRNSRLEDANGDLQTNGIGLATTQQRLQQLYREGASFRLERIEPEGVCASIRLPLHQADDEIETSKIEAMDA